MPDWVLDGKDEQFEDNWTEVASMLISSLEDNFLQAWEDYNYIGKGQQMGHIF